ncbi:hypothetical protein NQ314_004360 [Rhamnusium bicolor]|uniref:Dihydrolipoamide acetyltransferase component of pyruvate dehydrogenase complex n=1 Tax=Rhamnusium bicolor TaxID=1586634 RepID=A0AAV8ZJN9_9CUCU|nr:hypothetical protein NQ314_004360 [Rhamnusium bicolor]
MFRTIILRSDVAKDLLKKAVRARTLRNITIECTKRRHYHKLSLLGDGRGQMLRRWKVTEQCLVRHYSGSYPSHTRVTLPALSPTMEMGTIISWEKKEGDKLNEGDLLAEIETDKATMGLKRPRRVTLPKFSSPPDRKMFLLVSLFVLLLKMSRISLLLKTSKMTLPAGAAPRAAAAPAAPAPAPSAPAPPPPEPAAPAATPAPPSVAPAGGRVYASPMAKRLAEQKNIRLQGKGTGLFGAITSADIPATGAPAPAAISASPGAPAAKPSASPFIDIPVTGIRATIAKRLLQSKQSIPHYYLSVDVNVPEANSCWLDSVIRQYRNVDVSVAVSTDRGLITPIVFQADTKGVSEISKAVKTLAAKAREGKLKPEEFQGGTFSVFREAEFLTVTLSCDHRTVDGAIGALWLKAFKGYMEDPVTMII